jgi:hypothetical protein
MKYLKRYKLFEELPWTADGVYKHEEDSVQKRVADKIKEVEYIKETIKDILLPISDMGYNISIQKLLDIRLTSGPFYKSPTEFVIRVVIYTDKPLEITDDVKDEFDRMVNYLKSLKIDNIYVRYVEETNRTYGNTTQKVDTYESFSNIISNKNNFTVCNLLFVAKTDN